MEENAAIQPDIVERLRGAACRRNRYEGCLEDSTTVSEAADEIERLRTIPGAMLEYCKALQEHYKTARIFKL